MFCFVRLISHYLISFLKLLTILPEALGSLVLVQFGNGDFVSVIHYV